jgi:hypothetical protein
MRSDKHSDYRVTTVTVAVTAVISMRRARSYDVWAQLEDDLQLEMVEPDPPSPLHATSRYYPYPQETVANLLAEDDEDDMPPLEPPTPPGVLQVHREANERLESVYSSNQNKRRRTLAPPSTITITIPPQDSNKPSISSPRPPLPKPHRTLGPLRPLSPLKR